MLAEYFIIKYAYSRDRNAREKRGKHKQAQEKMRNAVHKKRSPAGLFAVLCQQIKTLSRTKENGIRNNAAGRLYKQSHREKIDEKNNGIILGGYLG